MRWDWVLLVVARIKQGTEQRRQFTATKRYDTASPPAPLARYSNSVLQRVPGPIPSPSGGDAGRGGGGEVPG
jgi:hypothetical protein